MRLTTLPWGTECYSASHPSVSVMGVSANLPGATTQERGIRHSIQIRRAVGTPPSAILRFTPILVTPALRAVLTPPLGQIRFSTTRPATKTPPRGHTRFRTTRRATTTPRLGRPHFFTIRPDKRITLQL